MFPLHHSDPAYLVLESGAVFCGYSVGALSDKVGELVFNTAMTGYQEIISDPSYHQQIITFTYPHIGNVGCNVDDEESNNNYCEAIVVREISEIADNSRSDQSLQSYLQQKNISAISGVDTRAITKLIRDGGAQNCCLITTVKTQEQAQKLAQKILATFKGLEQADLAKLSSCQKNYSFKQKLHPLSRAQGDNQQIDKRITVIDYGVKHNILRMLAERFKHISVITATSSYQQLLQTQPDGILLSNGPGDPRACDYAIKCIRQIITDSLPTLGICLGHQLLALAAGAHIKKMKFGHHGANHPVIELSTGHTFITSQNHGFVVADSDLPPSVQVTYRSLFDNTIQGIRILGKPLMSFQGHPEASPGPQEASILFDTFKQLIANA